MIAKVNALRDVLSTGGAPKGCDKELRLFAGRTLMPSVLRPQGGAFRGEV